MQQKLFFLSHPIKKEVNHLLIIFSIILTSIVGYYILRPFEPTSLFNIGFLRQFAPARSETCDYSNGKWVWDEAQPQRRYSENCPFLDPGFRCQRNGRRDLDYQNWRWQPQACNLPRYVSYVYEHNPLCSLGFLRFLIYTFCFSFYLLSLCMCRLGFRIWFGLFY